MPQTLQLCLSLLFFTSACASQSLLSPPALPPACQESCITPFGTELGATDSGIPAYSNCQPKCVYLKPSLVGETFAGIQWQCVEFARRWLIRSRGLTFPSIDVAADLWNKVDQLEAVSGRSKVAKVSLRNLTNGSSSLPLPGDLLIYAREYLNTGHVAIVLETDSQRKVVRVGEENFRNEKWPGKFAREIPFVKVGEGYWLLDPYLMGWKTYGTSIQSQHEIPHPLLGSPGARASSSSR